MKSKTFSIKALVIFTAVAAAVLGGIQSYRRMFEMDLDSEQFESDGNTIEPSWIIAGNDLSKLGPMARADIISKRTESIDRPLQQTLLQVVYSNHFGVEYYRATLSLERTPCPGGVIFDTAIESGGIGDSDVRLGYDIEFNDKLDEATIALKQLIVGKDLARMLILRYELQDDRFVLRQ